MKAGGKGRDKLLASDTVRGIRETQCRDSQSWNFTRVSSAGSGPAASNVCLFLKGELFYKRFGSTVGLAPLTVSGAISDRYADLT